jgi:hypothetical protein
MKYGFVVPGGNDFRALAQLAHDAEDAGWDGVFVPDCIQIDSELDPLAPGFDPWVLLTAMAMLTTRIRLGTMLTPLSRRRPWKVARETTTLDHLSAGRLILPVGLGALDDAGFGKVGEATDRKTRAEMLDEALAIISGLWSGQPFSYQGQHYQVGTMKFLPPPVQQPRIPIWVAGMWPSMKSMRRALDWDGLLPNKRGADGTPTTISAADIGEMKVFIEQHRRAKTPFDIIMEGDTYGKSADEAAATIGPFAEAGATWWLEAMWGSPRRGDVDFLRERVRQGPPGI